MAVGTWWAAPAITPDVTEQKMLLVSRRGKGGPLEDGADFSMPYRYMVFII
jgi:hypothetical protein